MKVKKWILFFLFSFFFLVTNAQERCCDKPDCKKLAESLAIKITGLVAYAGKCSSTANIQKDKEENEKTLSALKDRQPEIYQQFIETTKATRDFILNTQQDQCFSNALPEDQYENIYNWIMYMDGPPSFPSTEFCNGWSRRMEIAQGAANIFTSRTAYLASLRTYLVHTFGRKCGGRIRLMAGPALFLRNNTSYMAFSSRIGVRLKDIAPKNFPLGNMNLFGEYSTSFKRLAYAAVGFEVELGPIGLNVLVNHDLHNNKQGFLLGLVFANKKL